MIDPSAPIVVISIFRKSIKLSNNKLGYHNGRIGWDVLTQDQFEAMCLELFYEYYYAKYKNNRRFKIRIHSDIQCMHRFLMSDAFTVEFSKGMENLFATSDECANLSMRLSLNVVNILWSLLPEDIVDKRNTPYEDSIYSVL